MNSLHQNVVMVHGLENGRSCFSFISPHFLCVKQVPRYQIVIDSLVELGFVPSDDLPQYVFIHKESNITLEFHTVDLVKGDNAVEFYDLIDNDYEPWNYKAENLKNFKDTILDTLNGSYKGFGDFGMDYLFPSLKVEQDADPLDELTFEG